MSLTRPLLLLSVGTPSSPAESYSGDPLAELGIYDDDEDTTSWTFDQIYGDAQWQEQQLSLVGAPRTFSGPTLGIIQQGLGHRDPCESYFLRFWTDDVLARIVHETNR
jgi:hypothetical protein